MKKLTVHMMVMVSLMAAAVMVAAPRANATVKIVAASPELADIARSVGGNKVSVESVAKPNQDLHMIEPRPSYVTKIAQADMILKVGLDLDMWMDALINESGNTKVNKGGPGYVDCSVGVKLMELPNSQITGASGDIHAYGNPHYIYDPQNGKVVAYNICVGLDRVSPANAAYFNANYQAFIAEADAKMKVWLHELAPYKGRPVVIYHASAIYFLRRFGLKEFATLEPKPGVPPSAAHVNNVINAMKASHVTALCVESVYPLSYPNTVVAATGAKLEVVPYSVGALGTKSYFEMIDMWVQKYKQALQ